MHKWESRELAGYIDYCCIDKMSRLELLGMAKELDLQEEGCTFWWLRFNGNGLSLAEIKNDADALEMASNVSRNRLMSIYAKVCSISTSNDADKPFAEENVNLQDASLGNNAKEQVEVENVDMQNDSAGNDDEEQDINENVDMQDVSPEHQGKNDEGSELYDSDYSFDSEEEDINEGSDDAIGLDMVRHSRNEGIGVGGDVHEEEEEPNSDYGESDSCLHSASSTDDEDAGPSKPKYPEFQEEIDMKDPHFAVGMKFSSFKQFKEAVRNYGIKHRYVMNFRPSNKKRCKAICKKGCPFYLWAAPMIKDKDTIQIKSGILKHECSRDHNVRHVSAKWIAQTYMTQFRADPGWSLAGIIQAVKQNQEVEITRLKAWRAKSLALRYYYIYFILMLMLVHVTIYC